MEEEGVGELGMREVKFKRGVSVEAGVESSAC